MKKRLLLLCGVLCLLFCAILPGARAFSDCEGHWAEDEIDRAAELGFFSQADAFRPDADMTRGMLAIVLANYSNETLPKADASLADVPTESASARAIAWAIEQGIMGKTGQTTFSPNAVVTREDVAAALVQFSNHMQVVLPHVRGRNAIFTDVDECSDETLDAVYTIYRAGIIGTNDTVHPKDALSRAECAVILCRYAGACTGQHSEREEGVVISHKGYWVDAPENTLPAFLMAKQMKYSYLETDVRFTADNVPVLSHEAVIDNLSDGTGAIAQMTLEQLRTYDFSKNSSYSDVPITTLEQYVRFCAKNYIHPVIELKTQATDEQLDTVFSIVSKYKMEDHVTWISFQYSTLERIRTLYPSAEMSYLVSKVTDKVIAQAAALKTESNDVYLSARYTGITNEERAQCIRSRVYLQLWTISDKQTAVENLNTCTVGITVDALTRKDIFTNS